MTEGKNSVVIQGSIQWPELKETSGGKQLFKCKLKIPTTDSRTGESRETFLRITAWDEWATWLGGLERDTVIRANTRINERSYVNNEGQKRNVTDLVVESADYAADGDASGENFFVLEGTLQWPELKKVGPSKDTSLFHAKVKIPYYRADEPDTLRHSYVRITAWDEIADNLNAVGDQGAVKVSGHIAERSWTAPDGQKRLFTDAVVTNFVPVGAVEA